jgi:hypothetical protein
MSSNTIILTNIPCNTIKEAKAGGAITPGHLLKRSAAETVVVHSTAAGRAQPLFALENETLGKDIDTAYAQNERISFVYAEPGAEINAIVAAGAAAIAVGDFLCSAGDGTLKKVVAPAAPADSPATADALRDDIAANLVPNLFAVAVAMDALDNSAGSDPARLRVEVL